MNRPDLMDEDFADVCSACGEVMELGPCVEAFEETGILCCDDCAPEVLMAFGDDDPLAGEILSPMEKN